MELLTIGREQPDWIVPLVYQPDCSGLTEAAGQAFRLVLVESGTGIIRQDHECYTILAPALFCLNELDTLTLQSNQDLKGHTLFFHPQVINSTFESFAYLRGEKPGLMISVAQDMAFLDPFLKREPLYYGYLSVGPATAKRAEALMVSVHQQLVKQVGSWPCRGRSYFLELLFLLDRAFDNRQETRELILQEDEEMNQIILYLHNHYHERITLVDLTQIFHMNRTTLIERFTKATGETIKEYLINLRLRLAALILRDTLLPITEIMARVGFKDITHFGRMFKKHTGLTPSDYRRKYCWMLEFYPDYQD